MSQLTALFAVRLNNVPATFSGGTGGGGGGITGGGVVLVCAGDFPSPLHPNMEIPKKSTVKTRRLDIILTLFIIVLILYANF